MTSPSVSRVRLAAVGDLLLTARPGDPRPRGLEALSQDVRELLSSCDLVFANLECTLAGPDTVPTEPRVIATEEQVRSLGPAGVGVVTLGNNHAFDCLDEGFHRLRRTLDAMSMPWCGAGDDLSEALRPAVVTVAGVTLGFLGVVDGSAGPHRFADEGTSGVARLAPERVGQAIRDLRRRVDHVIVSPHWGEERFRLPSPEQIEQAHQFVEAGASLVLGHHPHVLQGMELHRRAPIAYSLGNFLAGDVYWATGDVLTWDSFERTGCILVAELDALGVLHVRQVPTFDDGVTVSIETSGRGDRYLRRANRLLSQGVTPRRYARERFRVRAVKPLLAQLRWSKLRTINPKRVRKAIALLVGRMG